MEAKRVHYINVPKARHNGEKYKYVVVRAGTQYMLCYADFDMSSTIKHREIVEAAKEKLEFDECVGGGLIIQLRKSIQLIGDSSELGRVKQELLETFQGDLAETFNTDDIHISNH